MADIELEVVDGTSVIELEVIEAQVKPEVVGQATPSYDPQTVTPPAGSVFSAVEVGAIPDPTAEETITKNGTHHVERVGVVKVEVPQGVFPSGTKYITANGVTNVREYEYANVMVPEWISQSQVIRFFRLSVTLDADFSGTAAAFVQRCASLADVENAIVAVISMTSEQPTPTVNEVRDLTNGYITTGWRMRVISWYNNDWRTYNSSNGNLSVVGKKDSVYDVVGFVMV